MNMHEIKLKMHSIWYLIFVIITYNIVFSIDINIYTVIQYIILIYLYACPNTSYNIYLIS